MMAVTFRRSRPASMEEFVSLCRLLAGLLATLAISYGIVFGIVGHASASEAPKARPNPMLDENRQHDLSVFSFLSGPRGQAPVLVTLNVKGPKALTAFCEFLPKVNEAVLNVMMQAPSDQPNANKVLVAIRGPLKHAINGVLPGHPVRKVNTRAARTASEFGPDLLKTKNACKAIGG